MTFIDKWSLFEGYFVLFYQGVVIEVWLAFTGWSLSLNSGMAFYTGLTVHIRSSKEQ